MLNLLPTKHEETARRELRERLPGEKYSHHELREDVGETWIRVYSCTGKTIDFAVKKG